MSKKCELLAFFRAVRPGAVAFGLLLAAVWPVSPAGAIVLDGGTYYRLEARDDGWIAQKSGSTLILAECQHEPEMRFRFTAASNGFYAVSTESGTEVLTVSGGSTARGAAVVFAANTGADHQLWQVVDLGDGYCKLVAKHSGLVLGHTMDTTVTDPINNDATGAQFAGNGADNTEWLIAASYPAPYKNLGVNQNGWAPGQKKVVVYTSTNSIAAPSYSVTGPQTLSGTMTAWASNPKWGLYFYTANVSALTNEGRYTVTANGLSQEFNIFANPFAHVRGIRGGEVSWTDVVNGFIKTQSAPSMPGFDTMNKATGDENIGWTEIAGTHTMTNGLYDATSRDSKLARTASSAKFIALAMLETQDAAKKTALRPVAQMLVDHLTDEQNANGSFPLGKFRTAQDPVAYHWSTTTDTGMTARNVEALALLAQALNSVDNTRATRARTAASNGWSYVTNNPNNFLIDTHPTVLPDYWGSQASVIAAAIELYLLTSNSTYSTLADSRINEATYNNGIYKKSTTPAWPGTYGNKMDDLVDAHTIIALCRYYPSASAAIKTKLDTQIAGWASYWLGNVDTPWGVPENGGAPAVISGWGRNLASLAPQFLKVADLTGRADVRDAGTAIIDYLLGNNAVASSFYVGAGQRNLHPRFKWSSEKTVGAVVPGIKTEGGLISLTGQASKMGESVTMQSLPLLTALALADKKFSGTPANTKPMFAANPLAEADGFVGEAYSETLADDVLDPDGDALTYSLQSGPAWLSVNASNGVLSGTPTSTGTYNCVVRVSDASGYDQVNLPIKVQARIPEAPNMLSLAPVADAHVKEASPSGNFGTLGTLELRKLGGSTAERIVYLKFTVSGANDPITNATLRLYSSTLNATVNALSVSDTAWTETSVTWSSKPATGALIGSGTASAGSWFTIDVSSYVTNNGTYSMALDEQSNVFGTLISKEGANPPALLIYMQSAPPSNRPPVFTADPISKPAATPGAAYAGQALAGSATDADGDTLTYVKAAGPDWLNVAANGVLSGTPASYHAGTNGFAVQVSDGALTDTALLQIVVGATGAATGYGTWLGTHNLFGTHEEPLDDADGDGILNLREYALNGNPTNAANTAVLPTAVLRQTGGTNWIEYVYLKRTGVSDLLYQIQSTTNLVSGPWTNAPATVLGSAAVSADFNVVSNRVDAVQNTEFLRLNVLLQ